MATLRLRPEHGRGRPVDLAGGAVSIGRHPDNTICLHDDRVSRFHAVLEADEAGRYAVRDLGSRNGVKINGQRVSAGALSPGDVLRVGKSEFVLVEVDAGGDAPGAGDAIGAGGGSREPWAVELCRILEKLPPKGAPAETIELVSADGSPSSVLESASAGPVALRLILRLASKAHATDIHIEPKDDGCHLRVRVDGQMVWIVAMPREVGDLAVGTIRTVCQFKQVAKDSVQDGHFSAVLPDRRVEFRVSLTPSMHGPKAVLRVLDGRDSPHALEELGLAGYMSERIRRTLRMDSGLLLVCGPTGSGKTTTLYNALREIDRDALNVVTIEDPVEYTLEGVTQMPVDAGRDKDFAQLLRSVLRQDPDVILVGEIRDEATARTAMQAAMTGHLVLSTVHAKDSISAVFRLLDLKIEPYLVAHALDLVLAQRLVRKLCPNCAREVPVTPGQATRIGRSLAGRSTVQGAVGCARCLGTGYRGRVALFELLDVTDELRDVILGEPSIQAMRRVIDAGLFTTIAESGWRLVASGVTSIDEVERVAGPG